jgi:hypothetical protein
MIKLLLIIFNIKFLQIYNLYTYINMIIDLFLRFKKIELDYTIQYLIPHYRSNDFTCMSCNKLHNGKSSKCCSLENSPVKINKAELYKIEIPHISLVNSSILRARTNFVDLHFPDILSTIILR